MIALGSRLDRRSTRLVLAVLVGRSSGPYIRPMGRGRPPQIVAYGGGGFSHGAGQSPARRVRASGCAGARSRRCASSRRRRATPTTTSCASTATSRASICDPSHVSLFRRDCGPGPGARAPAQAGHDLRRRRLDPVAARRLARARDRRGPARRVAGGCHPCRRVRRFALLVRVRPDGLPPRRAALRGARLPAALQRRALRGGVQPAPGVPRRAAGRLAARRIRGLGRGRAALRRRRTCIAWCCRAPRRAPTASRRWTARSSSSRWRRPISASRPKIELAAA